MVLADPQTRVCLWTLEVRVCACTSDHPSLPADEEKGICVRFCVCVSVSASLRVSVRVCLRDTRSVTLLTEPEVGKVADASLSLARDPRCPGTRRGSSSPQGPYWSVLACAVLQQPGMGVPGQSGCKRGPHS